MTPMSSDSWCGKEGIGQTGQATQTDKTATQTPWTGPTTSTSPLLSLDLFRGMLLVSHHGHHCRYYLFEIFKFICVVVNLRGGRVFYYAPLSASGFHCCRRLQRSSSPFSRLLSKVVEAICQSERRRQNVRPRHFNLRFRLAPCSSCFHFIQGVTWQQSRSRYQRISKYYTSNSGPT